MKGIWAESAHGTKLDTLKIIYWEKILLLKLKAGDSLVEYIDQFHALEIVWQ